MLIVLSVFANVSDAENSSTVNSVSLNNSVVWIYALVVVTSAMAKNGNTPTRIKRAKWGLVYENFCLRVQLAKLL